MNLLRNSELFSTLLDDDLIYLLTRIDTRNYTRGTYIFSQGEVAANFYIIKSGEVMISQVTEDNQKHVLAQYISGDSFGEFDFVTGSLYDAEAKALSDCTLLVFPAAACTIENMALEKPGTIARLYLRFLVMLSKRLRSVHQLISENSTWIKQLQEGVYIDQHTGLYTHSYLEGEIPKLVKQPAAIILIKPDRFKEINDTYGHQAGDAMIERMAAALLRIVETRSPAECEAKAQTWAIRLRGNEMALVLQQSTGEETRQLAQMIATSAAGIGPGRIATTAEEGNAGSTFQDFQLTVSIAAGIFEHPNQSWQQMVETAYGYLKKAWKDGGNRIYFLKAK